MVDGDRARVATLAAVDPGCWVSADVFEREFAAGHYRSEWTWLAVERGRFVARALWWGRADAPLALDCVWVDPNLDDKAEVGRLVVATGLDALAVAGMDRPPQFELRLPASWREDAGLVAGVDWRRRVAASVGLSEELERLQLAWHAGTPLVRGSGRLQFVADDDDTRFLELFRRVTAGSLDESTRRAVTTDDEEAAAREVLSLYRSMPGDRDWWRLARDADGRTIGFVIPSATEQSPNVGYLGVVPEARGRRYADDLLAEATHFHARRGAERISATTDISNVPMAAAFARQGYRVTERRVVFSAPRRRNRNG